MFTEFAFLVMKFLAGLLIYSLILNFAHPLLPVPAFSALVMVGAVCLYFITLPPYFRALNEVRHRKTSNKNNEERKIGLPIGDASTIKLSRSYSHYERLRTYHVLIDEKECGVVYSEESETFQIEPGPHTMRVKIDFFKTKPLFFSLNKGERKEFLCGSSFDGPKVWLLIFLLPWYLTFGRTQGIWLKEAKLIR